MKGNRKTGRIAHIILRHMTTRPRRVLVVGCGTGVEAAILGQQLAADVIGIDIKTNFDPEAEAFADLRWGDATALDFEAHTFDLVYSYHALEHIPDYRKALREMKRVLTPEGAWYIGVPNRSRLIGYVGSEGVSLRQKLAWNWADWRQRLQGRFRNEFGAHAGFTAQDLTSEFGRIFGNATDISLEYYRQMYPSHVGKTGLVYRMGLSNLVFPSIYFMGKR